MKCDVHQCLIMINNYFKFHEILFKGYVDMVNFMDMGELYKRPAFVLIPRFIYTIYMCVCMLQFIKNKVCLNQFYGCKSIKGL